MRNPYFSISKGQIMKNRIYVIAGLILFTFTILLQAQQQETAEAKITVEVDKPGHSISPTLFGIFFEDINLSADGGIYPELVRNRSFEDADTLQNWKFVSADNKSTASISTGRCAGATAAAAVESVQS